MNKLRVLDLFSGIGGFSLGLERAGGFETVAFCEIEEYPRRVLAKHWPGIPCYDDVRTLTADRLAADGIAVDVICGGFPCQDVSFAGKRAGLEGARSGLWREYARLIGELRPKFVLVENVPGLLNLGMGAVLGDLSTLGYDAVWDCVPASAVGAPHRRDRVWIVAHTKSNRREKCGAEHDRWLHRKKGQWRVRSEPSRTCAGTSSRDVADSDKLARNEGRARHATEVTQWWDADRSSVQSDIRNANVSGLAIREGQSRDVGEKFAPSIGADWWVVEPDVGRVAHGVPSRVDRLKGLGNAVVPHVVEAIGRAIMSAEASR